MYNYGTAAEVLDTVFDIIEGGKTVEAAKTTALIADNGAKIFDITASEAFAANGSAAEIQSVVSMAEEAATGTTAGAGILSMEVGAVGAAIAPALGIAAGFGLYNLAPEFWTNVADKLVTAGQTVKGKVQALIMPDGTTAFSPETIEIFKNELLDAGAFNAQTIQNTGTGRLDTMNTTAGKYGAANVAKQSAQRHNYTRMNVYNEIMNDALGWFNFLDTAGVWGYVTGYSDSNGLFIYPILLTNFSGSVNGTLNASNNKMTFSRAVSCTVYRISFGLNAVVGVASNVYNNVTEIPFNGSTIDSIWGTNDAPPVQEGATLPQANVPFTTTYPNWLPFEFPSTLPVEMPDYYPLSMPTPDATQDPSQAGANETETQLNKLIELLFQNLPENNPEITPDPDPSPEPEPEPSPTPPEPEPNPPDPNPPVPDPIPTIPIPTLETTRADRMFTVYNPTDANVNSLGAFLWTNDVIEQIKKLWEDPMQAIISFHKIYGAPTVGSSQEIVLGYIESGVSAPVVTSQFCDVDCGSVTVPELLNNATSYAPFTSLHIYLPFIGIMELDTNECMKATLHVKYRIDVYTGTCIALIYVSRNPDLTSEQVLYTFSGNASQQLPLTASSFGGAISALLGLAGAGVAVASGGALGVAAGAVSAAHSLTQEMVHINRSGGLSANAGILGSRTPYLILSRQYCSDANGYAGFYGYPSNKTVYIGNCNGYIKCKDVIFRGSCTQAEAEEIESLLKSGVYV